MTAEGDQTALRPARSNEDHEATRPLERALAALRAIDDKTYVYCLYRQAGVIEPPPTIRNRVSGDHILALDHPPLEAIDTAHHQRLVEAWKDASCGVDRVGRATVRATRPLRTVNGHEDAPAGWYDVQVIDLIGNSHFDVMAVTLQPTSTGSDNARPVSVPWFQGVSTFRFRVDGDGTIEGGTLNVADVLGRPLSDLVGARLEDLVHPDDVHIARTSWQDALAARERTHPVRFRMDHADRGWQWFESNAWNLLDVARIGAVVVEFRDVQEQVEAALARLATSRAHDRLIQILDEVDDMVMVSRLGHGLVYLNRAARSYLGIGPSDAIPEGLLRGELRDLVTSTIEPAIARLERWTGDIVVPRGPTDPRFGGDNRIMAATVSPVVDEDHDEIYYGIIMRDVTAERTHARALAEQARRDPLTGLPNRLALMEYLQDCRRYGAPDSTVAVWFIDIDNLKVVNDGLGHSAGDRVLRAVADRLGRLPGNDIVARFGGDEFTVVFGDLGEEEARATTDRVLEAIESVKVPAIATHVTASVGVARVRIDALDPEGIIRDADAAMYVAKQGGRARSAHFDGAMREQVTRRFVLQTSLRQALSNDSLAVHLQPICDIGSDPSGGHDGCRVAAFEALARWGSVPPYEFIPVAEESGLIVPLGQWVLEESLQALLRFRSATGSDATIEVNVSGRQLLDPGFAHRALATIEASGLPMDAVALELTESVLIDQRVEIDRSLLELHEAGVRLALDDFGSGYSSLGYLRRYPIDILKLDTGYTQALGHDRSTRIITEAVVSLAERLGLSVVAEGVETPEQLDVVHEVGIRYAQGFLLGRPAPIDDLVALASQARAGSSASTLPPA